MRTLVVVAVVLAMDGVAFAEAPAGSPAAKRALATCDEASEQGGEASDELLERALRQAEQAVAADPDDALAHFAVFCALGERMRRRGTSVRSLLELRRLRQEIDRTLELAPDFSDALAGKGALLLDAPGLLGGDAAEAERLLRRAVALDPEWASPRLDLARALQRRGATAEAAAEARRALAIAERKGDEGDAARARALLAELRDS